MKKSVEMYFPTDFFYYIVIETYALKLSKSSAWKFWMYAE